MAPQAVALYAFGNFIPFPERRLKKEKNMPVVDISKAIHEFKDMLMIREGSSLAWVRITKKQQQSSTKVFTLSPKVAIMETVSLCFLTDLQVP